MKKLFRSKTFIFAAIMALFIIGQIVGTVTIRSMFLNYKIEELSPQVENIAGEIAAGGFEVSRKNDFIVKAYDVYGKEMDIYSDESNVHPAVNEDKVAEMLISYIPKVIAGNKVADLENISGQPSESIIIGTPVIKNGSTVGAVFLLKPASDFSAVLNGFYIVFSVTLLAGTGFIGMFLALYLKETKQLEQTRRDYIANISHELKSPIASIKALTETLADNMVQDENAKNKYYSIILKESGRLQKLISDMLELSRLQTGGTAFQKEVIDTRAFMHELDDKYFVLADEMGISFEITEKARNAPDIYSNRDRLLQLFNILIDNAIKFVGENGRIIVDSEVHRGHVTMQVLDNGTGIGKSALPYVFDRFYKEEEAHNTRGSGLGLSIAKEIAEGLGEDISVSSEYGKGTVFSFTAKKA